ncbi:MAG: ATP-dependent DNA helicase RecG, partial [Rhizobiaceae bacterium]
ALPFALTGAQERAIAEISADLERPERMLRLLQGDVGSGKTVVALLAAAQAAETGAQTAFLAPTEILARQHHATIEPVARAAGFAVALLTGREKGRERARIVDGMADGSIRLVVGTHALFQEGVAFADLGLAVIDEQHRFGVHQRLAMTAKGEATDLLVMTATPIPRTLVLTAFGDMDVSRLDEKPPGRAPVRTVTLPAERLGELVSRIRSAVERAEKAFWICPLVEDSTSLDPGVVSAESRSETLGRELPGRVWLVHGRMSGAEKDRAMEEFRHAAAGVLVATTVVEVGVDVPDAAIMVIENAERFGLAQLHQLRGRVGRGDRPGTCVLLYHGELGETAHRRLETLRETNDGFVIAEEDLKLRGEGELLGVRQSGVPGFSIARVEHHGDLLAASRADARALMDSDPVLQGPRGQAVRLLLYLFGRDDAIRLLSAG